MPILELAEYEDFKKEMGKQEITHIRYAFAAGEQGTVNLIFSVLVDNTTIIRYVERINALEAKERLEEIKKYFVGKQFSAGLWSL